MNERDTLKPPPGEELPDDVFGRLDHIEILAAALATQIQDAVGIMRELAQDVRIVREHFRTVNKTLGEHERRLGILEEQIERLTKTPSAAPP